MDTNRTDCTTTAELSVVLGLSAFVEYKISAKSRILEVQRKGTS